jgi:hypothetical protein
MQGEALANTYSKGEPAERFHNKAKLLKVCRNRGNRIELPGSIETIQETDMGFGRGALLWLIGIPLPIILLLALFWR